MTGVTVLLFDHGAKAGIDISGGGRFPGKLHSHPPSPPTIRSAIVLSGGSAFGLAASDGVMRYLEEHGIGYETGFAKVPLVCQSCIYDLSIGRSDIRPDAAMGLCCLPGCRTPASGIRHLRRRHRAPVLAKSMAATKPPKPVSACMQSPSVT